jgi:hypothetical protein
MTEQKWLSCTDPVPMLEYLRDRTTDRKLRLFAVACCRNIWHLLSNWKRQVVEYAEQRADGQDKLEPWTPDAVQQGALATLVEQAGRAASACLIGLAVPAEATSHAPDIASPDDSYRARMVETFGISVLAELDRSPPVAEASPEGHGADAHQAALNAAEFSAIASARTTTEGMGILRYRRAFKREREMQASLLRDIFGNPFHPTGFDLSWRTPTVAALVPAIYDGRAFDRMPELADALEQAGCREADILAHCRRAAGPHVRGCWVLDLLQAKQ